MAAKRLTNWMLVSFAVVAVLVVAGVLAFHIAARSLKADVIEALGPESEVADLTVGITRIVISGVRVKAPRGWPANSTLRADSVEVVPDLRQLLARRIYVNKVIVENAYISAVRPKEGGGIKVLPSMLGDSKKRKAEKTGRTADIQVVELHDCVVELFDATISGHQKMRVDAVHGTIKDLKVPKLTGPAKVDLNGIIKGTAHQGTIAVTGWVNVANKSSELTTRVRNVDLAKFEPYVIQKVKSGVDEGTFNLDIKSEVNNNIVNAHGELILDGLKLKKGEGPLGGFQGLPQRAVLGALADKRDQVKLDFELKGDLDNPGFSLSEGLGLRTATALLKALGLGFEGLVRAFFALVTGFGSAFSSA
jgi:hypothetical protein